MKNVAICSLMRAGSPYEQAYYLQILALARQTFSIASVNIVYDREPIDSQWLRDLLFSRGIPVRYQIEHVAGRDFERLEDKAQQWATTCNQCVDLALANGAGLTHLAWIESDISYPYDTIEVLLSRDKPIIAPLVYLGSSFYDTWAFRDKTGKSLTTFPAVDPIAALPMELNSVGSFVLCDVAVFRSGVRFRGEFGHGLMVGVCEDAAEIGFPCYADPTVAVLHPRMAWLDQIWRGRLVQVFIEGRLIQNLPLTPSTVFAGPYEHHVRSLVESILGRIGQTGAPSRITIVRHRSEKAFDIRVDL